MNMRRARGAFAVGRAQREGIAARPLPGEVVGPVVVGEVAVGRALDRQGWRDSQQHEKRE